MLWKNFGTKNRVLPNLTARAPPPGLNLINNGNAYYSNDIIL